MHIRNGQKLSLNRSVTGGSSQGTKLGNFLFCVTLEGINSNNDVPSETSPASPESSLTADLLVSEEEMLAVPDEYRRSLRGSDTIDVINENFV